VRPEDAAEWFEEIEDRGVLDCEWCVPAEQKAHILVVRRPRIPPDEVWLQIQRFI
jgi:hypothetical protein